ncbi:MAG: hypothetical protein H0V01_05580 [Bacteroidetes bacterium]|nr:hypothetical protein [Bacteroidota bacterium]HET6244383.1 hypothetical protein [Bacteroidia bacterium]
MIWLKFLGGLISFVVGFWILIKVIKDPIPEGEDIGASNYRGFISGFGFIILGIILVLNGIKELVQ